MQLVILSFISCQKDTSTADEAGINIADDDAVSEAVFEDVFSTADNAAIIVDQLGKGQRFKIDTEVPADSCPVITITNPETGIWPKTITVDFGYRMYRDSMTIQIRQDYY